MSHAIKVFEYGGPDVLRWEPNDVGAPSQGEVRLRHEAIGVNFVDIMVRDGRFSLPVPLIPGFEGAGVITDIGSTSSRFRVGDRVGYFFSAGAYSQERVIDETALVALPDDITSMQSAMFLATGFTAWMGLRALHDIRPDQTIMVLGASGSVGSVITRWATHAGARVIGVAGSAARLASVAGAAHVALALDDPALLSRVRKAAPQGVDVVFDLVGAAAVDTTSRAVRDDGKVVAIGAASGQPQYPAGEFARRRVTLRQGSTPQYVNADTLPRAASELFGLIREGVFADLKAQVFDLADARLAHEAMERRSLTGLPVLRP